MDTDWLRSFVVLSDTLHFGRSATKLHLSQSAVSMQIKKLEDHLGTELLTRNRHSVALTRAGRNFLVDAQRIVHDLERAEQAVRQMGAGERGVLRIAFVSTGATEIVPEIVRLYRSHSPDVELSLQNLRTTDQVQALLRDDVDVGFLRLPFLHDKLDIKPIWSEPFLCFLPKRHRLAAESSIQVKQLRSEPFFLYDRRRAPGFSDRILQICLEAGFSPSTLQDAGEMQTILSMISAGMGVSILPASAKRLGIQHVVAIPLEGNHPCAELGLAHMQSSCKDPLVCRFVKHVTDTMQRRRH